MEGKLFGFCIFLLLLPLLLLGCNDSTEQHDNTMNLNDRSSDQEGEVQSYDEPNYMETVEIVKTLEEAIESVNNFIMSGDELDSLLKKHIKSWVYEEAINRLEYRPPLLTVINNGVRTNTTVTLNDVKGMSVEEIIETYKEDIDKFNEEYYGNIIYEPYQVSEAYDDGYFIYVFVKQHLKVDKILDLDVHDVTLYKKYIFVLDDGEYIITDLNNFEYFDDGVTSTKEWFENEQLKYEVYKDGEIWKD